MSIRLRLALLVAGTSAVLVVAAGVALEINLDSSIRGSVQDSLRRSAARVAADLARGTLPLVSHGPVIPTRDQSIVQVLQPDGTIAYTTERAGSRGLLSPSQLAEARSGPIFLDTSGAAKRGAHLLLAEPSGAHLVVIGAPLDELASSTTRVRTLLAVGGPLLVVVAGVGGWLLAGQALRPVERLRAEAAAISVGVPERRLEPPRTHDELERLADTLNSLLDRLHGALAQQKEFVAAASHELRTPLAAMRAELEVARLPGRPAREVRHCLDVLAPRVDQLTRLTEDLLLLARGDGPPLSLERTPAALEPLVAESLQVFRKRADARGLALVLDGDPSTASAVDILRFRQVVDNLVENALTHATGSPYVEVSVRRVGADAVLEICDRGPGFPEEFLPHAFDRFTRAAPARSRPDGGSGLGLAIVRMLVEAHGGLIEVGNRAGGGASALVRLPAVEGPG